MQTFPKKAVAVPFSARPRREAGYARLHTSLDPLSLRSLAPVATFSNFHVMWYMRLMVVGGLLFVACSSQVDDSAPASTAPVPAVTTVAATTSLAPATTVAPTTTVAATTTVAPTTTIAEKTDAEIEADIIAAYRAGWDDFYRLVEDPTADPTFVEETNQDIAPESALSGRRTRIDEGSRTVFPDNSVREHRPEFQGFEDGSAIVRDCYTSDSFRIESDGTTSHEGVATGLWFSKLELFNGRWTTTLRDRLQRWEGVVPLCDE